VRRSLVVVLVLCVLGVSGRVVLLAQTPTPLPCPTNCVLARQAPFAVAFAWAPTAADPEMADGFHLYQNGVVVQTAPASALANGVIRFSYPNGLQSGNYIFNVSAFTNGGEAMSDPITLTVLKGRPAKPTNGRLE
jgi:hypothetical protein